MESLAEKVEFVKAIVGRFFPIYEVRVRPEALAFYVRIDPHMVDDNFEGLRQEMKLHGYIPILRLEGGEHVIFAQRIVKQRFRGPILNLAMLIATLGSTIYAGMLLWAVTYGQGSDLYGLSTILNGALYFALPLMAILGTHEMGHYLTARRHNVAASLPFFIPLPLSLLGTLGAFISMREPIPNKKALMDIGIAGPLAGLAVAFPVTLIGLYMNSVNPVYGGPNTGGGLVVHLMPLFTLLLYVVPIPSQALLHPTAFAGWVGFFVTAINLLPAGQLDGGHVARALLGKNSRYLSYGAFFVLLAMGFIYFPSWLILAFLVLILGLRHPPPLNDLTGIRAGRKGLGLAVLVILVLSFVPQPIVSIPVDTNFEFRNWEDSTVPIVMDNVSLVGGVAFYSFYVNNTGNVEEVIRLSLEAPNLPGWNITFTYVAGREVIDTDAVITLNSSESAQATVFIRAPDGTGPGQTFSVKILGTIIEPGRGGKELNLRILT